MKLWFKSWREFMNGQCSSSHFKPRASTAPAGMSRSSGSAYIRSPIGLANKLVQFKERPLYSCSLKAAYTKKKPMRRTSDIKNFKTQKNFTLTFKSILLYIHKRGCKIKMTEKESRSKVT